MANYVLKELKLRKRVEIVRREKEKRWSERERRVSVWGRDNILRLNKRGR